MAGPWEKYAAQQGPWTKYRGAQSAQPEAPPNAGLAPPASPGIPAPLQPDPKGWAPVPNYAQAAREGTLKDLMLSRAMPYAQSAQQSGGFQGMVPVRGLAGVQPAIQQASTALGGAGRIASFAQKYFAPRWLAPVGRVGDAMQAAGEAMKGYEMPLKYGAPGVPEVPLTVQRGQAERVAGRFGRPTSGAAMDEPLPSAQRVGDITQRYQPRPAPTGRPSGARPPRPSLIDQMGGRPVEDISESDAAVRERMESSPEVQYGLNAKAHRGSGSRSYPEPSEWQEAPEGYSPWNIRR